MNLKTKLQIGSALLVAVPIIICSVILGYSASNDSLASLQSSSEAQLVSVRNITKGRIEDYLYNIDKQVKTFSKDKMIVDAMKDFSSAYNKYPEQSTISIKQARGELSSYYNNHFNAVYRERNNQQSADTGSWLNTLSDTAVLLQHKLIQTNPNPLGEKHLLTELADSSDYAQAHKAYHPAIKYFLEEFEYYDVFLVDAKSGNIVYSVFKELDYATSLNSGTFSNTGIARVFKEAIKQSDANFTIIDDFSSYPPSYQDPAAFIASPIMDDGEVIGSLIFQMPIGRINQIMTHENNWKNAGLGDSGETYLVGQDLTLRSQSRFLIEDKDNYLRSISAAGVAQTIVDKIDSKDTAISLQPVTSTTVKLALDNKSGVSIVKDYRNVDVLSAYSAINYPNLKWAILAEIDEAEAFASAYALSNKIQWYSLILGCILISLGAIAGGIFARSISRPIVTLSRDIDTIEKNSDLTFRLTSMNDDEIGSASNALNNMMDKFHSGIKKVSENAQLISESAGSTSKITSQSNELLATQKKQTQDVVESMQLMTSSVESISSNVINASETIQQADQKSNQGHRTMEETIELVGQLANQIDTASVVIDDFEEHSNEIISVLAVIKGIAEQTNLLALNAAIEAARAGDQGSGFAVVAEEVRAIAARTQSSTSEINVVLEKLVLSSKDAVTAMEKSQSLAKKVVTQASNAGQAFSEVSESVASISALNKQINNDVIRQQKISAEIDANISNISDITNENVVSSAHTAQASQQLATLALDFRTIVKEFKI